MRYHEIINEMPELVSAMDWDYPNPKTNRQKTQEILSNNPATIGSFPTANLVQLDGNFGGQIALISTKTNLMEYYVHYEITNFPALGRCATQVKLWRHSLCSVMNIASKVFDEVLLTSFDTIVSDSRQTDRGREFWLGRIAGYANSKTVGLMYGTEIRTYDLKDDLSSWIIAQDAWGKGKNYRYRRFFISNKTKEEINKKE